jgi:cytochrome c-type biogenesis protein
LDLLLGFLAGALTLLNPCVLPVLPFVLASAAGGDRLGPVWLCAGLSGSFVLLGLALSALGPALGIYPETVATAGAVVMVGLGVVLLVPLLGGRFAQATAGMAARADAMARDLPAQGAVPMVASGALLGAVWVPCIGPTLGAAIALAATGQGLAQAGAVMMAYAAGLSAVLLGLAYGARGALARNKARMIALSQRVKPALGGVFVLVGVAVLAGWFERFDALVLDLLPDWFAALSVTF